MIYQYGVSLPGTYHLKNDIPCQDYYCFRANVNSFNIYCVADGLGSAKLSQIGSELAATKAMEFCQEHIAADLDEVVLKEIIQNAFVYSAKSILERAKEGNDDVREYLTTLCLVLFDGNRVIYGNAGDGGVLVLREDGLYSALTQMQRNEEGDVYTLFAGEDHWEFGCIDEVVSVLLATDGVWCELCPPILKNEKITINIPLARKFMDRDEDCEESVLELQKNVTRYLEKYPSHLNDDKTILVGFNSDKKAQELDSDYYNIPNWSEAYKKMTNMVSSCDDNTKDNDSRINEPINND